MESIKILGQVTIAHLAGINDLSVEDIDIEQKKRDENKKLLHDSLMWHACKKAV